VTLLPLSLEDSLSSKSKKSEKFRQKKTGKRLINAA
jgi:hypothetical protein